MSSNSVVSIRVEALGVSITIADGSIAIEQTKTEIPAATVSKTESPITATSGAVPASATEREPPVLDSVDDRTVREDSGADFSAPVIDELEQTLHRSSPLGSNGLTGLPGDSAKDQEVTALRFTHCPCGNVANTASAMIVLAASFCR